MPLLTMCVCVYICMYAHTHTHTQSSDIDLCHPSSVQVCYTHRRLCYQVIAVLYLLYKLLHVSALDLGHPEGLFDLQR